MPIPKTNYVHLQNGRFAETSLDDVIGAFQKFSTDPPEQGWVIHFHGGLNNRQAGMATAEALLPVYESAGAQPLFFVWESGPWETIRNNLGDISREPFFRKLVARLMRYLLTKLSGFEELEFALSGVPIENSIEDWFDRGGEATPFDELSSRQGVVPGDSFTEEEMREELTDELTGDGAMRAAYIELELKATIESVLRPTNEGVPVGAKLDEDARQELFGTEPRPEEVEAELAIVWAVQVARIAARIGFRVLKRFRNGRDHGLKPTVIEESLRELYADSIGSTFFWKQMKKDTKDAFGGDPVIHGGTAFLEQLKQLIEAHSNAVPRVTLVGHSAGAIFVSNLLIEADTILPVEFKFDVVLLAPAVDCALFQQTLETERINNLRLFGMTDHLESRDALLSGTHAMLAHIYPCSLLYFVSGLLETEVDLPLIGMQRYYVTSDYPDSGFESLASVRSSLAPFPDRLVWSPSDQGPGRRSQSQRHGDFDREDAATLSSVAHVIKHGFVSVAAGVDVSRASVERSLEGISSNGLNSLYNSLPLRTLGKKSHGSPKDLSALLDLMESVPGGYLQVLAGADRLHPESEYLRSCLSQPIPKTDVAIESALLESQSKHLRMENIAFGANATSESSETYASAQPLIPVLVRVRKPDVKLDGVAGLEVVSRLGSIVAVKANQEAIHELETHPQVLSVEMSAKGTVPECATSLPFIGVLDGNSGTRLDETGDEAIVAIIDAGIDVLHAAFRTPDLQADDARLKRRGKTRILAVWDQRDQTGPPPPGMQGIGGTLHTAAQIDDYIQSQNVGKNLGRDTFNPSNPSRGHGTHVASIAAGADLSSVSQRYPGGVATEAKLVVVITQQDQYEDGSADSLGYSLSHNAAMMFVDQIAAGEIDDDALFRDIYGVSRQDYEPLPLVVNLSQGMNSGAHDGTSLVEQMFEEFCFGGRAAGRVVVKSAGNDRQQAGHAFITLNSNSIEILQWESQPTKFPGLTRIRDVIEVWFDSLVELSFQLVTPSGERTTYITANQQLSGSFNTGNQYQVSYDQFFKDNGRVSRLRIDISRGTADAIEAGPKPAPFIRPPWQLEITSGVMLMTAEIDAWIDRTDGQPARFVGFHVSEDRTLSVPGTSESVISVGAIRPALPLQVGAFSAYGTTLDKRKKPEVSAPGIGIVAAAGGDEYGIRVSDGTSMAAPHVTGAVALVLSACHKNPNINAPNATQIIGALRGANWDRGSGYGPLNTTKLLERFSVH